MTLSEYIKMLQIYEPVHGSTEVVMTQSGYYAEGNFADLYHLPEIFVHDGTRYLSLGHSHQSY